jgi:hypothetical protein
MEIKKTSIGMINFDLTRDRDVIFRRTIAAIQVAIKNNVDIAELPNVKVAESEIDAFVLRDGWEDAIEKAKKHFEKIEDYEMCHTCMSLIEQIKKSN